MIKSGEIQVDLDTVTQQTKQDELDLWKDELSKFKPAPRETEADKANDITSTERKLEESLTLLVEQQIGKEKLLLLPQGKVNGSETLRQAVERVLKEHCGPQIDARIYGNAPCGYYRYKYPKDMRDDIVGAKIFFYRAALLSGAPDKSVGKFEWLTKEELNARLSKFEAYKKSLNKFII